MTQSNELTAFCKRLQAALKRRDISLSLSDIRDTISNLVSGESLTEELQHTCLDALIRKYQPSALVEPQSVIVQHEQNERPSEIVRTTQHEIVTNTAASMGIVLAEADIIAIANQLDYQADSSVTEIIAEAEVLLTAYADHKKQESKDKVSAMLGRVYDRVSENDAEVSQHLSTGLQQFASDLEVSQQEFKRQARQAFSRLKIPANPA